MFQFQGIWLPDGEAHFPSWMQKNGEIVEGRGTYQIKKWRACLPWIKSRRVAIDVGAHVGFWSIQMAKRFQQVHAFEPMQVFRDCFRANIKDGSVYLYSNALGATTGFVAMNYDPADSGNTHVAPGNEVMIRLLDEFAFNDVGFIKIDCEGYEAEVIKGAEETLMRCRPCVIVEQKQHKMTKNYGTSGTPAVDLLRGMGAVLRKELGGDYILSWE